MLPSDLITPCPCVSNFPVGTILVFFTKTGFLLVVLNLFSCSPPCIIN